MSNLYRGGDLYGYLLGCPLAGRDALVRHFCRRLDGAMDKLNRARDEVASKTPMESKMDQEDEIKRLRARIAELEIDAKAIFTGAVTHEILAELRAAKKRLAELQKMPHPKG